MKTTHAFDLGYIRPEHADRVQRHVHGKTFMNFQVSRGTSPGGDFVTITTNYSGDTGDGKAEAAEMLMHLMAQCLRD